MIGLLQVEGQETECIPPYKRFAKGRKEPAEPAVAADNIAETAETGNGFNLFFIQPQNIGGHIMV